ncbi:transposase, partial [Streptomyces sp. NPDC005151]
RLAWAGYPTVQLMALVETGTRGLLGACFGPAGTGETSYAKRLLPLLGREHLVLIDRGFDSNTFLAQVAATGAQFLARCKSTRRPPLIRALPDGSYLTRFGDLTVRVIEADIVCVLADGTRVGGHYRLATTLLDPATDPAERLTRLYAERWEIESAFFALRSTLMAGRVLRSGDQFGIEQELWATLALYQALRTVMVDTVESRRAPTPTAPASPPPYRPHAPRSSSPPRSPPKIPSQSARSAPRSWRTCCPPAARASAPARSNPRSPATTPSRAGPDPQPAHR